MQQRGEPNEAVQMVFENITNELAYGTQHLEMEMTRIIMEVWDGGSANSQNALCDIASKLGLMCVGVADADICGYKLIFEGDVEINTDNILSFENENRGNVFTKDEWVYKTIIERLKGETVKEFRYYGNAFDGITITLEAV
jgi:hypothetical protein